MPRYQTFPPPPYALTEQVDVELDHLGVKKKDRSIRLCADFKVSLNQYIEASQQPILNTSDLLASIAGANVFSKLDLSQAYAQLPLPEGSLKLCVITTHRGMFAYTRLPFGVSSAPLIW